MGLCTFNYVFYMPPSLPLLHTAMPTPCLNAFWHSDPYIFLQFVGNVFLSCFCEIFLGHLSSLKTDNSRQVLECLVLRLMRTDEVRKILWYRGPSR